MAKCSSCSAPLPPGELVCSYCGLRNDVDLQGIHHNTTAAPDEIRTCPNCDKPMPTIDLKVGGKFLIERCKDCKGLFFDSGELEFLLEKSVTNVFEIDHQRLDVLSREKKAPAVRYIKCPVCAKIMNRVNFGHKSGVVADKCKAHGTFLESGELKALMEWMKAGGQLLHHQMQKEKQEQEAKQEKRRQERASQVRSENRAAEIREQYSSRNARYWRDSRRSPDLFDVIGGVIRFFT